MSRPWSRPLRWIAQFPGSFAIFACTLLAYGFEHALGGPLNPEALLRLGALRADRVVEHGELWRLVAPMFLHFGPLHLVLNLLALRQLGPAVELFWGSRRFVVFYVVCGVAAALFGAAFTAPPRAVSMGASGALMGLAGLLLGASWYGDEETRDRLEEIRAPLLRAILLTFGIGLMFVVVRMPILDNAQHLGGMVCGLLLAAAYPDPLRRERSEGTFGLAVAGSVVVLAAGLVWVDGKRVLETFPADMAELTAIEVSENPGSLVAIAEMVDWHAKAGLAEEGQERLERALDQIDNGFVAAKLFYQLYDEQQRGPARDRALAAIAERWIELEPDDPDALNSFAWFLVTRDPQRRDPGRAEALSRKSLERIDPADSRSTKQLRAGCLDTLAEALYLQARYEEARSVQREAVRLATETQSPLEDRVLSVLGFPTTSEQLRELEQRLQKIEQASG